MRQKPMQQTDFIETRSLFDSANASNVFFRGWTKYISFFFIYHIDVFFLRMLDTFKSCVCKQNAHFMVIHAHTDTIQ